MAALSRRSLLAGAAAAGAAPLLPASGAAAQEPVNPAAGPRTRALLSWLAGLKDREGASGKVVSGQFVCPGYGRPEYGLPTVDDCWRYHVEELRDLTGHHVGVAGFDPCMRTYKGGAAAQNMPDFSGFRDLARTHHDRGGIVHLTWHAPNPFTEGHSWSALPAGRSLAELTRPGTAAHTRWMSWLDAIADGLLWFADHGVPVVWRPLHELNGDWFWWGGGTDADFVTLWRHMYDHLAVTRGVANVLWTWCPDVGPAFGSNVTGRYPGNDRVDIVAFDRYGATRGDTAYYTHFRSPGYGKVLAFSEVGLVGGADTTRILTEVRSYLPEAAFFMFWMKMSTNYSIRGNPGASALLNDAWTLGRDDVGGSTRARTVVEDTDPRITYSGAWTRGTDTGYRSATKTVSNTAGATARWSFTGTQLRVYARTLPAGGRFEVRVDGALLGTADTYDAVGRYQALVFERSGVSAGSHTAELRVVAPNPASGGAWVGLDFVTSA